jgi:glycosyltransferase involved in cell wall biosynthesis
LSKPPRIAIDATVVGERTTGAGRAVMNLVAQLPRVDQTSHYVTFASAAGAAALPAGHGTELIHVAMGGAMRWELVGAGRAARVAGADLLFTVRELTPLSGPPTVVHIYEPPAYRLRTRDLRSGAALKRLAKDAVLHLALGRSLGRAAAVTAGSATTAAWLRERVGITARVVYPGIDPVFLTVHEDTRGQDEPPYFLHQAGGDDRENTGLVLDAFARARLEGVRLVLSGAPESMRSRLGTRVRELGLEQSVELLGWVTDERLRDLYRGAVALLHPTRYESFAGFPALEAMALGTPVVALDAPGATEALSGAALLLTREDPDLLAAELRRLVEDKTLRDGLAAKGHELARPLTWESSARALANVFHDVLNRSAPG